MFAVCGQWRLHSPAQKLAVAGTPNGRAGTPWQTTVEEIWLCLTGGLSESHAGKAHGRCVSREYQSQISRIIQYAVIDEIRQSQQQVIGSVEPFIEIHDWHYLMLNTAGTFILLS
jgi:hypothetical protein